MEGGKTPASSASSTSYAEEVRLESTDVLANHHRIHWGEEKKFPHEILGYVTPVSASSPFLTSDGRTAECELQWNNHGYDVAKWLAGKFTSLAPVWFQVIPKEPTNHERPGCAIAGNQDNDQGSSPSSLTQAPASQGAGGRWAGWLSSVRENNSAIGVLPRFILEKFSGAQLRSLLTYEDQQNACAQVLLSFIRVHFHFHLPSSAFQAYI